MAGLIVAFWFIAEGEALRYLVSSLSFLASRFLSRSISAIIYIALRSVSMIPWSRGPIPLGLCVRGSALCTPRPAIESPLVIGFGHSALQPMRTPNQHFTDWTVCFELWRFMAWWSWCLQTIENRAPA